MSNKEKIDINVDNKNENPKSKGSNKLVEIESPIFKADKSKEGVDVLPYFHGFIPRDDVIQLLKQDGNFLLRVTELMSGDVRTLCLSVKHNSNVHHFPIQQSSKGTYTFDGQAEFTNVVELIEYYYGSHRTFSKHNIGLVTAVVREEWELIHHQVKLVRKIGEGAFGSVYYGLLQLKIGKIPAAVKTLKCDLVTKNKIEEIMNEARLMRQFNHPNIVACYGVAADMEPLYVIMEYIDGGVLTKYLEENGPNVSVEQRLRMAYDASIAIEYIHGMGIIHCDIAARNCLYHKNKILKISDFGLSKQTDLYILEQHSRTPIRWTAPETFTTRTVTRTNDIWALGVLFWEIFNNAEEPYAGWSIATVVNQKFHLELPSWSPNEMKQLVENIFTFEPEKRIQITEICARIKAICAKYDLNGINIEKQKREKSKLTYILKPKSKRSDDRQPRSVSLSYGTYKQRSKYASKRQ